ncbi:MAG: RNA polymerase sigma factor [Verrucomicrobia bacterium]|jgi:RNA polymerase sigma-70 factor (ECF subfamily)|nr:RNA polymerase sigma factor [Verrucomicrobiota bacterium]
MKDPTEDRLLARCRAGDPGAWDDLFDRHYAPAYRFVFQLGFHLTHEDAEEICQEAFLSVIRNLASFQGGSTFQTWLFRIAANKARDFMQKQSAAKRGGGQVAVSLNAEDPGTGLTLDPPDPAQAPDVALARAEQLGLVHQAVAQLDLSCRELVELRYFGELSYDELAAALGVNAKTVSSRLSRCLDRLEALFQAALDRENIAFFPV